MIGFVSADSDVSAFVWYIYDCEGRGPPGASVITPRQTMNEKERVILDFLVALPKGCQIILNGVWLMMGTYPCTHLRLLQRWAVVPILGIFIERMESL